MEKKKRLGRLKEDEVANKRGEETFGKEDWTGPLPPLPPRGGRGGRGGKELGDGQRS